MLCNDSEEQKPINNQGVMVKKINGSWYKIGFPGLHSSTSEPSSKLSKVIKDLAKIKDLSKLIKNLTELLCVIFQGAVTTAL